MVYKMSFSIESVTQEIVRACLNIKRLTLRKGYTSMPDTDHKLKVGRIKKAYEVF